MSAVFDIYDSATNTEIVNKAVETALETGSYVGPSIAPLKPVNDHRIKRGRIQIEAFGVAQIVARTASPAIFVPAIDYDETWIELVKLDEMSPIEEDEWHDLTGDNEYLKNRVGVSILQRARIMQLRAERKTEQMRWLAFHDALTGLAMADSGATPQTISVVYGQPSGNRPTGSNWNTRTTSTPITDVRTAQRISFNLLSQWGLNLYMNSDTWENLQYSKQVADLLKPNASTGTDFFIPTRTQVEALLIGGDVDARENVSGRVRLTITDAGFRAEGQGTGRGANNMTYFLPKDYVLITTQPLVDGENIADVPDGRVAVKSSPTATPEWKQGAQNETFFSQSPPYTQYNRQVCKRIPRINVPEAFVYMYVGAP